MLTTNEQIKRSAQSSPENQSMEAHTPCNGKFFLF